MWEKKEDKQKQNTQRQPLKKSSFLTQLEQERNQRIANITSSHKKMSTSGFLDPGSELTKGQTHSKAFIRQLPNTQQIEEEFKRARSLRLIPFQKGTNEGSQKHINDQLYENVIRLRLQEISFKIKTKVCSLLRQINISPSDLSRFAALTKVDDILSFFSLKIRQKLTSSQITEATIHRARSREKTTLNQYEAEMDILRKRLQQKETSEKTLKTKLKETNNELRQVFEKLSSKQKELSGRMTELYQLKTTLKENEQMIQTVQMRYDSLSKEVNEERDLLGSQNQVIVSSHKEIQQQNMELIEKIRFLNDEVQTKEEKCNVMIKLNSQLNRELTRWRERFEDNSPMDDQDSRRSSMMKKQFMEVVLPNELKKSTMSMNDCIDNSKTPRFSLTALELENLKLSSKVQDIQLQNRQLSKDLEASRIMKEQYEAVVSTSSYLRRDQSGNEALLQKSYRQKMEEAAEEWKDKLVGMVNKYEDDLQALSQKIEDKNRCIEELNSQLQELKGERGELKSQIQDWAKAKDDLQRKVLDLTNQKYELESKTIKLEKQIYELLRAYKDTRGIQQGPE